MAETDSFIEEVSEEVRRDRLFGFFKKWGWLIALGLALIVGAAAFNEWQKSRVQAQIEAAGDALAAAISAESPAAQAEAFAALAPEGPDQTALTELGRAAALLADGREDDAYSALTAIKGIAGVAPIYADLAALKAAMMRPDAPESADSVAALAVPGRPFHLLALELRAQQHVANGDTEAALADLKTILQDAGATRELRVRAEWFTVVLGGEVPTVSSLVPVAGGDAQ